MRDFAVAVVGAGPAGLLAAWELSHLLRGDRVCLLDRGGLPDDRTCRADGPSCTGCPQCELIEGLGGAGFFVDGKICDDPNVGQRCKSVPAGLFADTFGIIEERRKAYGISATPIDPSEDGEVSNRAQAVGFDVTTYPVSFFGSDRARLFGKAMATELEKSGVQLMPRTDVVEVEAADGGFRIQCRTPGGLQMIAADRVLLAVGRSGASWLADFADRAGIRLTPEKLDLGLRLEAPASVLQPLSTIGGNPKLKLPVGSTYVKTHCLCSEGFVLSYKMRFADVMPSVVDGHSFHGLASPNSNVNLLMRIEPDMVTDPLTYAHSIAWNTNLIGKGAPVIQRLGDLRAERPSVLGQISTPDFTPSLRTAAGADLNLSYPRFVIDGILKHIDKLDKVSPGIAQDGVVLYGPAFEWGVGRADLSFEFETAVDGMYMAGDATGQTSGVLTAAATGIHAARCLAASM
jgi:uncharacterized protein